MTCIREGVKITEAGRLLEANAERHLKTTVGNARACSGWRLRPFQKPSNSSAASVSTLGSSGTSILMNPCLLAGMIRTISRIAPGFTQE